MTKDDPEGYAQQFDGWARTPGHVVVTNTPRPGDSAADLAARANRQFHGAAVLPPSHRTFETGATRDTDENKLDFEGFLSPQVIEAFAKYMHEKRKMPDGSYRDSDNWQKGIPVDAYMKSMWRHFFAVWKSHRIGGNTQYLVEELLALMFNVQGMAHELLKHGSYK